ncbi:MAG: alpha/beta hydrolase [Pseudobutyrivibrio sp.]|nr:alpha/beta hydrolase [Pseudobutyrivibrio sp.]
MKSKITKKRLITVVLIAVIVLIGVNRFYSYVDDYYQATDNAWSYINNPAEDVSVTYVDNTIVFAPDDPIAGFIFYPGGLVETEAYAPLMEQLAENGVECILVEMPFYLAMFDANGARGIQAKYPEISEWYIGGHSLGGAMASLYAHRHVSEYEGLVLLASYSTKDFSNEDIRVLSIYGSEDGVLNRENYEKNKANLPDDFDEVIIPGGCHGYFGDYGMQAGDGKPSITVDEQTEITVENILKFIVSE